MSGHKDMPEELQEKLEDMLTSIVHDLTTTTTPAPDTTTPAGVAKAVSELAEEYNSLDTTETTIVKLENVKALEIEEEPAVEATSKSVSEKTVDSVEDVNVETATKVIEPRAKDEVVENQTKIPAEQTLIESSEIQNEIDETETGELEVTTQHINIHQPKQLGFVDASALAITTTTSPNPITTTSAAIELLAVTTTPVLIEPLAVTTTSSA